MASYLRLEVGPYFLLIPTDEVFEVLAFAPKPGEDRFVVWRGQILPAVSMRHRLGLPEDGAGVMIVHGEDGPSREALVVDRVVGLVELEEGELQPIPVAGTACLHFDKVWTELRSGRQALRMRPSARGGNYASNQH